MKDMGWVHIDVKRFAWRHESLRLLFAISMSNIFHYFGMRKDGRKYFTHPEKVCKILIFFNIRDIEILIAAIFHDVPEEVGTWALFVIDVFFGTRISKTVSCLTRRSGESFQQHTEQVLGDSMAVLIKIADRIHNVRNLTKRCCSEQSFFSLAKLEEQVKETKRFIIPMALMAIGLYPDHAELICKMLRELIRDIGESEILLGGKNE